ncbi:hypothetical protein TWF225_009497 [Orbilia oligospora]|uniref:Uncharacterized protein n=1 Tax=Orbilia oligospora TaxID=2813651 RepID=A0A7C8P6Q5_ORBOL|nr:hypothetical protein TWF751_002554 [Orbilia oligospora]KAF3174416.1 hypothetical protein TWF225_009497 [Orbilia oligospora]KAF3258789.1 hypothetical protein TWF128_004582 [Orbilia oligospora]KAF3292759.1 hypothetical protein TWF132_005458 [Orbilia oligospora]TGJ66512.1 hypothetical protein EYR41_008138 [Orbilia oligospora]
MAPHILNVPNEVTDLILDEFDESIEAKMKLMSTCRHFRRYLLPQIYSACQLNFGRTATARAAILCDKSAGHIWPLHKNYPEHGRLVKTLSISFNTNFTIKGPVLDETDGFEKTRSPQYVLGNLLPRFDTLKTAKLYHGRTTKLSIDLAFCTSDRALWRAEERKLDACNGWTRARTIYSLPQASLEKLDFFLLEKDCYCPFGTQDLSKTAVAWLIGIFLRLLELPCRSLKSLNFKCRADRHRSPDPEFLPLELLEPHPEPKRITNRPGGQLRLPKLEESLSLVGIYDNVSPEDLIFLRKLTGLSVLHLRYLSRQYFMNWIWSAVSLREPCQSLKKVVVLGQGSPSTDALEEFMENNGKIYNARIEEEKVPDHLAAKGIKPDDFTLYLYTPLVVPSQTSHYNFETTYGIKNKGVGSCGQFPY